MKHLESFQLFESSKSDITAFEGKTMRIKKGRTFEFRNAHSSMKIKEADGVYTGEVTKPCKTHPSSVWFKIATGPSHNGSTVMVKRRDLLEYDDISATDTSDVEDLEDEDIIDGINDMEDDDMDDMEDDDMDEGKYSDKLHKYGSKVNKYKGRGQYNSTKDSDDDTKSKKPMESFEYYMESESSHDDVELTKEEFGFDTDAEFESFLTELGIGK